LAHRRIVQYCQICNTETLHVEKYHKWDYPILQCSLCLLGSAYIEGNMIIQNLYNASYYEGGQRDGYQDYLGSETILRREFNKIVQQILHYQPSGRLLEIGCAYGFFLLEAKKNILI
jgi:hypothetical protein